MRIIRFRKPIINKHSSENILCCYISLIFICLYGFFVCQRCISGLVIVSVHYAAVRHRLTFCPWRIHIGNIIYTCFSKESHHPIYSVSYRMFLVKCIFEYFIFQSTTDNKEMENPPITSLIRVLKTIECIIVRELLQIYITVSVTGRYTIASRVKYFTSGILIFRFTLTFWKRAYIISDTGLISVLFPSLCIDIFTTNKGKE